MKKDYLRCFFALIPLSIVFAGCAETSLPKTGTATVPTASPTLSDTAFIPLSLTMSDENSRFSLLLESTDDSFRALYADVTLENHTQQTITVQQIAQVAGLAYGDSIGTAETVPADTILATDEADTWMFGEQQLTLPLTLQPGEIVHGSLYCPGGYDEYSPVQTYLLEAETSVGRISYRGIVQALSTKTMERTQPQAVIDDADKAQRLSVDLNTSQILQWVDSVQLREAAEAAPNVSDGLHRMVSQLALYLTRQGVIAPVAVENDFAFYDVALLNELAKELTGLQVDFDALTQPLASGEQGVPLQYACAACEESVTVFSLQKDSDADKIPSYTVYLQRTAPAPGKADETVFLSPCILQCAYDSNAQYWPWRIVEYYVYNE